MTRETKIGLLVGLAFIIVIGILLSDHFRATQEPPDATLDRAGATVRQTVNAPGSNLPNLPITLAPEQVNPRGAVQTPGDLQPQPSPVVLAPAQSANQSGLPANDPLTQAAQRQGEQLVPVNSGETQMAAVRSYTAQPGDSVSRMAAKLLGANTRQNRQTIIAANPSLQSDPDMVVVGQTYIVPSSNAAIPGTVPAAVSTSGGRWVYTVKPGDTLWGIATGQLGDARAIEAIKELNRDQLHGGSTLQPGMKLRLPSEPVAIAQ